MHSHGSTTDVSSRPDFLFISLCSHLSHHPNHRQTLICSPFFIVLHRNDFLCNSNRKLTNLSFMASFQPFQSKAQSSEHHQGGWERVQSISWPTTSAKEIIGLRLANDIQLHVSVREQWQFLRVRNFIENVLYLSKEWSSDSPQNFRSIPDARIETSWLGLTKKENTCTKSGKPWALSRHICFWWTKL